jgi:hypothetical protein
MVTLNRRFKGLSLFAGLFAMVMLIASGAQAATITWGAATNVNTSDPTQVSTSGTFFGSATMNSVADQVVNGVTFFRRTTVTTSSIDFAGANITLELEVADGGSNQNGGTHAPSANTYNNILSFSTTAPGYYRTISITGLTPGNNYQVQIWTPLWDGTNGAGIFTWFSPDEVHSDGVRPGTVTLGWGEGANPPQYSIGTFTADGTTTQGISWQDQGWAAIQVRDLTVVPEPSAIALASVGIIGLFRVQRRRRA